MEEAFFYKKVNEHIRALHIRKRNNYLFTTETYD